MNVNFSGNSPFDNFKTNTEVQLNNQNVPDPPPALKSSLPSDVFKTTSKGKTKVNPLRIWFSRLTQEQIDAINETKTLPDNMKVRPKKLGTGYDIFHNIFGLKNGTHTIPEGWELRRNKLGFTRLVPVDSEGFWLKKK